MANGRPADSVLGLFLRLYWIMLGNGVLVVTAALPVAYPRLPAAPLLGAYALVVVSLIAARYLDVRFCGGQTIDGDPADLGHWKRYVGVLLPISFLLPALAWGLNALLARIG
ncbi:MAG TPA: hypothetical protein VN317_09235 [Candidatus Methanoperedens sp.]|nr:hypothetical protein [Candidatus Methanoperedens sp.]